MLRRANGSGVSSRRNARSEATLSHIRTSMLKCVEEEKHMTSHSSPRRIAIITGASRRRGIGAAICLALAQAGTDIFFTHWSPYDQRMPWGAEEDEPIQLQKQVQAMGVRCEHLMIDLGIPDAPQRIIQVVEEQLGLASILVN